MQAEKLRLRFAHRKAAGHHAMRSEDRVDERIVDAHRDGELTGAKAYRLAAVAVDVDAIAGPQVGTIVRVRSILNRNGVPEGHANARAVVAADDQSIHRAIHPAHRAVDGDCRRLRGEESESQ